MSPAAAFNRVTQMHAVVLVPTVMTYCSNESIVTEASELLEISGCCFLRPSLLARQSLHLQLARMMNDLQAQLRPPHREVQVGHGQLGKDARYWVHLNVHAHPRISAW